MNNILIKYEILYEIGQTVYLKTDPNQFEHIVTRIVLCPYGVLYGLSFVDKMTEYYDFEISTEKDVIKAKSN